MLLAYITTMKKWVRTPTSELLVGGDRVRDTIVDEDSFRMIRIWDGEAGLLRTRNLEEEVKQWLATPRSIDVDGYECQYDSASEESIGAD